MKYYKLDYNGSIVAVSNDMYLIELFIVQRELGKNKCDISRLKGDEKYNYADQFLFYYFGYAVTSIEYEYICSMNAEYESSLACRIYELENTLVRFKKVLTNKEKKAIKKSIKALKRIDLSEDVDTAKEMIDTILHRRGMIFDYLENLDTFRRCMEG
jgi:hypothetical protein